MKIIIYFVYKMELNSIKEELDENLESKNCDNDYVVASVSILSNDFQNTKLTFVCFLRNSMTFLWLIYHEKFLPFPVLLL